MRTNQPETTAAMRDQPATKRKRGALRRRGGLAATVAPLLLLSPLRAAGQEGGEPSLPPPQLLVNAQGWAQRDLSIRGGSYAETGISINGLNLKVPYSAHFNAELPIPGNALSAPVARYGLENAGGHLVGTLAYRTVPRENRTRADAAIGTKAHYQAGLSAFNSGIGGGIEWEKARRIDHDANDLDRYLGSAQLQQVVGEWQIDLVGSGQKKTFGAQGYYGLPAGQYAEQETEDALFFLGATRGDPDDAFFRASGAWRQFDDEITGPAPHDVRSRFGAVALEGRTMEVQDIALNLRGDIESEWVDGTTDGDRMRGSFLLLPEARLERATLRLGLNAVLPSSEPAEFLPQAGIDWFVGDNSSLYASYSETVQQPDFQTLENNPRLPMQKSRSADFGVRQFASEALDWRFGAFFRRLEGAYDWIGGTTATGLGDLDIAGIESEIGFYPSENLQLRAFYQWVRKDNSRTDGFYELDYPEHLLNFSGYWNFIPRFQLFAAQTLRLQTDNDRRSGGNFGANAQLGLHWFPRFAHSVRLSLLVDNLWGSDFQAIPGLKPPPRTVSTGIALTW